MGELYNRILKRFNISGRDFTVFLLALLLAFSTWLIHNLSLKYNAYIGVTIRAVCNLEGHSETSSDLSNVVGRCRATGYNLIRYSYLFDDKVRDVVFEPSSMHSKGDGLFYITSDELNQYSHLIYGNGVTVEYFTTDTLFFHFPLENSRKVPVQPVYTISYAEQHTNVGPVRISPDSVIVYGEPYQLDDIDCVYTEPIEFDALKTDIQGNVALDDIKGVRISEKEVGFSIQVTRYVEMKESFPLEVINLPSDKSIMVFPSNVEISLKCVFPMSGNPLEECRPYVDYEELLQSLSGKCTVQMDSKPKGVVSYEFNPPVVRCIVEDLR